MSTRDVRYNTSAARSNGDTAKSTSHHSASTNMRSKAARSLREVYVDGCRDASIHPSSGVLSVLPDRQGVSLPTEVLDMSRNFIGDKGIGPLLLVVQRSPHLTTLVLSENGLRNNAIKMLASVAASHPSIRYLDVSDNYISDGAGAALLQLVEENANIAEIRMVNTKIPVEFRVRINDRIANNTMQM